MTARLSVRELSARGRGAIRVLELCGEGALERLALLAPGRRLAPGEFGCLALRDARGELLDEALVLVDTPSRLELHLHGAPALVARVVEELGGMAGEPLVPATLEERAAERLASAPSEAAARTLLDQAEGALRAGLEELLTLEGEPFRAAARELARRGRVARWLLEPPRVVLSGPVNAGKSTLFNVLVGRERVVVDAAAGTTRDAVRERVLLGAYALDLIDTAGERALARDADGAALEAAGQALAAELRREADLVLWLVPPGAALPDQAASSSARRVVLRTLADLEPAAPAPWPALSALRAPEHARGVVAEAFRSALELPREPWVPGAAVPFEAGWTAELATGEPAALARAVRAWLARPAGR